MAIAYDAASSSASGTGNLSWTHTPVGTPRGVLVLIVQNVSFTDQVSSVTYGGVAMAEVSGSRLIKGIGTEDGAVYGYFLGAGIPTGAQTVVVTVSGSSTKRAVAFTVTAGADTEVVDTTATDIGLIQNPSVNVTVPAGRTAFIAGALHSGHDATTAISPASGNTTYLEHDFGSQVCAWNRRTSIETGSGNFALGWTGTSSAYSGILAVGISEKPATAVNVSPTSETDTAQAIGRSKKKAIGEPSETDEAQATARLKSRATGQPSEANEALSITLGRPLDQPVEVDTAQAVTHRKSRWVGVDQGGVSLVSSTTVTWESGESSKVVAVDSAGQNIKAILVFVRGAGTVTDITQLLAYTTHPDHDPFFGLSQLASQASTGGPYVEVWGEFSGQAGFGNIYQVHFTLTGDAQGAAVICVLTAHATLSDGSDGGYDSGGWSGTGFESRGTFSNSRKADYVGFNAVCASVSDGTTLQSGTQIATLTGSTWTMRVSRTGNPVNNGASSTLDTNINGSGDGAFIAISVTDQGGTFETDSALSLPDPLKTRAFGQAAEADAAQIVHLPVFVHQASEADTAQAIARAKRRAIGQPGELDEIQPLERTKRKALGQLTEVDEALQARATHPRDVGQATQTDTAQPIARAKRRELSEAAETDLSQPLARMKRQAIGQPTELSRARPVRRRKTREPGLVSETEAALALDGSAHDRNVGQPSETSAAEPVGRSKRKTHGQVEEVAASQPLERTKTRALGQGGETGAAQPLARHKTRALELVVEDEQARTIGRRKTRALEQADATETARSVTGSKRRAAGLAAEEDTTVALGKRHSRIPGQAGEQGAASEIRPQHTRVVGPSAESDSAQTIRPSRSAGLAQIGELSEARPVARTKRKQVGQALLADLAQQIGPSRSHGVGQTVETDLAQPVSPETAHPAAAANEGHGICTLVDLVEARARVRDDLYASGVLQIDEPASITDRDVFGAAQLVDAAEGFGQARSAVEAAAELRGEASVTGLVTETRDASVVMGEFEGRGIAQGSISGKAVIR